MSGFFESFGGLLIVAMIFFMWLDLQYIEPRAEQIGHHTYRAGGR